MKVNSIDVKNFKGISDMTHEFTNPVTVISGPIGVGKTSFLQALRFALTNESPVNAIRAGALNASVTLNCEDDICIEREIAKPNKKSIKVMGRKAGTGAAESYLEDSSKVTNEIMKLATASEVLAAMKPSEFGAIFLNESVEKKTLEDLLNILQSCNMKEKKAIMGKEEEDEEEVKFPAEVLSEIKSLFIEKTFNLDTINKAHEEAKAIRKERNAQYKISQSRSKGFEEIIKPEYSEAELNKKYEEMIGVEKSVSAYKTQVNLYNKALENKKVLDKRISELDLAIAMNHATEPSMADYTAIQEKKKKANEDVVTQSKVYQTLADNKKWFEMTISQLDRPVCPISEKLICKTDKTGLKADLEHSISKIEVSLSVVNDKINEAREKVKNIEEKISDYNKNKENYYKKGMLQKEKDRLIAHPIILPEKPEKLTLKSDYSVEKALLKEKMDLLRDYKATEEEYKKTTRLKHLCNISEFIVKALDPKGPVIKEFIETFVDCLEDACNERAAMLKSGFELRLIPEDGLKVLFRMGTYKDFLPYASLSAGEQIFASIILTDLINSFYDSRILILDDTDHLDAASFQLLLDFVNDSDIKKLYDHVIISCVEHSDMIDVIKNYEVDYIKM